MKEYCEKNQEQFKLYYKNRRDHYNFITQMMYLFSKGISPLISKDIDKFLNKLQPNDIAKLTKMVSTVINKLFNANIFNNSKITKLQLSRTEIPLLCFKIYEKIIVPKVNLSVDDNKKIINIITTVHNKIKEMKKTSTKQILNQMAEIFDDEFNDVYMENQYDEIEKETVDDIVDDIVDDDDNIDLDVNNSDNDDDDQIEYTTVVKHIPTVIKNKPVSNSMIKVGKTTTVLVKPGIKPGTKKLISKSHFD